MSKPKESIEFLERVVKEHNGTRFLRFEGFDFADISVVAKGYIEEPFYENWLPKVRRFYKAVKKYEELN